MTEGVDHIIITSGCDADDEHCVPRRVKQPKGIRLHVKPCDMSTSTLCLYLPTVGKYG
jgi:hypothetical protein